MISIAQVLLKEGNVLNDYVGALIKKGAASKLHKIDE